MSKNVNLNLHQNERSMNNNIDHSHIVLIIGDLNGLGHLPEFADQISGRQILANGPTRSDCRNQYNMRMVYSEQNLSWNVYY